MSQKQELVNTYLEYVQLYEQTTVLTEEQLNTLLLEAPEMTKKVSAFITWGEKTLKKKYNISVEPIRKLGKKQGAMLNKEFKKGTPPDQIGMKVAKSVKGFMYKQAVAAKQQVGELETTEKVVVSFLSFFVIIFISGLLAGLMMPVITNPLLLMQVTTVVIAPLVEEASKTFFIQAGMPWLGTGVVYGLEAVMYVVQMLMGGVSVAKALISRAVALMMHFSTTYIQKKIIDTSDADESQALFLAWSAGVAIHAAWNLMAVLMGMAGAK